MPTLPALVEVDHIDKVFALSDGLKYIALKNVSLDIQQGEFVSLIGHSGCGKSTLLNIIAGLDRPSEGGVILEGRQITKPGPDRMMVFQNYSLLPWKTVRENIALAVNKVMGHLPKGEQRGIIEHHIDLVGLRHAADKKPGSLSGGMKQRVAIARALSIRPKVLLLDEPFGALDALTRGNLQQQLMQICEESQVTCVMVTHDVDEALLLSDRIVMLTNGPEAHIGQILDVKIPRPRKRMEVVNHPSYYSLRNEMIYFLNQQKRNKKRKQRTAAPAIARNGLEKVNLEIGFIALTDCAPLAVAQEQGFFKKHGLEEVVLRREPSWKAIVDGVQSGQLDAAQMVAGMPLSMTLGLGGKSPLPTVSALVLSRNGNAITVQRSLYEAGATNLQTLQSVLHQSPEKRHTFGMVHPASMHNLLLRYWLAAGGINPDQDVDLAMIPPAQMFSNLKAGNIDGYCVGEPWNSRAVQEGIGVVLATDVDIWPSHPEKVLGLREDWIEAYPKTHMALVRALLEACEYCDDRRNRSHIVELLSQNEYVGVAPEYLRPGFLDLYDTGTGGNLSSILRFNQFFVDSSPCPTRAEGLWILTQMARWGFTPFPKNWVEITERVRRFDLYGAVARELGLPDAEPDNKPFTLFDGVKFDPNAPLDYLSQFNFGHPIQIQEILIDGPRSMAA